MQLPSTAAPHAAKAAKSPSTPLTRLNQLASMLAAELKHLPNAQACGLDDLLQPLSADQALRAAQRLNDAIVHYWQQPDTQGMPRRERFINAMGQSLRDEVALKVLERQLNPQYLQCLPDPDDHCASEVDAYSLHLHLDQDAPIDITGALAFTNDQGHTLLSIPGHGVEGYSSQGLMREALTQWFSDSVLRTDLWQNVEQRHQDELLDIESDPDLFVEPVEPRQWQLRPIPEAPFEHALTQQLAKQRADVSYALGEGYQRTADRQPWPLKIDQSIHLPALFGPAAALALRDVYLEHRQQRRDLPDWIKIASEEELRHYLHTVQDYEQARAALSSVLGGADSPEQFARIRLRARIANDLGYDLDPEQLTLTTRRSLPLTGDTYECVRTLPALALYGLHHDDLKVGSDFQLHSHLSLDGQPLGSSWPLLTAAYLGDLVDELELRAHFGPFQREVYGSPQTQQLMREVIRLQLIAEAYAAKLQNHITAQDFELINTLDPLAYNATGGVRTQQLKLGQRDTLSDALLFRKEDAQGHLERLVLFTPGLPHSPAFEAFDNERQLLHKVVGWTGSAELRHYVLQQVSPAARAELEPHLRQLNEKAQPAADFLSFVTQPSYDETLRKLVTTRIGVILAEHSAHTPSWYLNASTAQRRKLVALEDAISGASNHYNNTAHTQVQDFEDFVHQRATQKISALLGVAEGAVDPDRIIITSPRETLSFTRLLRDGYDDSIGFLNGSLATDATFSGPDGIDLSPLTPHNVSRSAHGTWLSDDYVAQINNTLLNPNSEGYAYRRRTSVLITQLQMQAAALRSLLKSQIDEQQYHWLTASINKMHVSHPDIRRRFPVYALQFSVNTLTATTGLPELDHAFNQVIDVLPSITELETVQGCYILTADQRRDSRRALLYTPQAPDGLEFRMFDRFTDTLKGAGMSDYYKDRCRLKVGRTLAFFLADMKKDHSTSTPPTLPAASHADVYEICFERVIQRKIRNVEDATTGRGDMLSRMIWNGLELVAIAVTLPFPIASFAVGAVLAFRDSVFALQALNEGDREAAYCYVLSSTLNTLGAYGDLRSGLKGLGGALQRLARNAGQNPAIKAAKRLQHAPPPASELRAITLQGEPFMAGKANASGYAPLYRRSLHDPEALIGTGQFAGPDVANTWQPLQRETSRARPLNRLIANPSYAVNQPLSGTPPIASGYAKGVFHIKGEHYIPLDGSVFQVQYDARMGFWNIVDPTQPYAFFGKQPVRFNVAGEWEVLDGLKLRGGVRPTYRPLAQDQAAGTSASATTTSAYEMPENMRPYIPAIVDPTQVQRLYGEDPSLEEYFTDIINKGRERYRSLREKLQQDASTFFDGITQAAKPDLPVLDENTTVDSLLKAVWGHSNGLVVAETPTSIASKQLLIDNMARLAEQNVEIIYIEHVFTDQHVRKLYKYQLLGHKSKSGSHQIKYHLSELNQGALNNLSDQYDYYHLIKAAHRHGIEVKPFNSSVSYHFANNPVTTGPGNQLAQQKMSVFFGANVIDRDIAADPARRWVALLDHTIATAHDRLPGIAELKGVISVRVEDVASNQPLRIGRDEGKSLSGSLTTKADFKLEMANPLIAEIPESSASAIIASPSNPLDDALYHQMTGEPFVKFSLEPVTLNLVEHHRGIPNPYAGDHGFQLDEAGLWQRADASHWTADLPHTAIQQSLIDPSYQIPVESRSTFHELANFHRRGLSQDHLFMEPRLAEVRDLFFTLRNRLQRDARVIISGDVPARPVLSDIDPNLPLPAFLDRLYERASSVVIGESHFSVASKKLIIDNMQHLSGRNIKTLYMEHLLTDLHQADLDRFAETGLMSKRLLHDLKVLDRGHHTDPAKVYNFEKLVIKAQEHGIEVRAIDCAASYYIKGMHTKSPTSRQQMMNYFASRTIRRHQEVVGSHKWIALVGNTHSNLYQRIIPGLAELEGGVGIRVTDVGPGQGGGAVVDAGQVVRDRFGTEEVFLQGDFHLAMETRRTAIAQPGPRLPIEARLYRPGMFTVDESVAAQPVIIHRSRHHEIHHTPVKTSRKGMLYIDRESWDAVHLKRFDDLPALVQALEAMNLTYVH